jgi:uncharacterized protein YndB with AHSA1/START domain
MNFDMVREVGLIQREVFSREQAGRHARVVLASRAYDTTIEDLWQAVTSAERIVRWFLPISGELRLRGRYQLQGNAGGRISECEPPHHFAVTWEFGGDISWLDVRLERETPGRTRLELEHTIPGDDARWADYGPGAVGVGWDLGLFGLARYLTSGAGLESAQAAEWVASEPAKAFMRGSSDEWCRASIASGTGRAVALAAARRTSAAYTGEPLGSGAEGPARA